MIDSNHCRPARTRVRRSVPAGRSRRRLSGPTPTPRAMIAVGSERVPHRSRSTPASAQRPSRKRPSRGRPRSERRSRQTLRSTPRGGPEPALPARRTAQARRRERRPVRPRRRCSPRFRAIGRRPPARSRTRPGSHEGRSARLCQSSRRPARVVRADRGYRLPSTNGAAANAAEPAATPNNR